MLRRTIGDDDNEAWIDDVAAVDDVIKPIKRVKREDDGGDILAVAVAMAAGHVGMANFGMAGIGMPAMGMPGMGMGMPGMGMGMPGMGMQGMQGMGMQGMQGMPGMGMGGMGAMPGASMAVRESSPKKKERGDKEYKPTTDPEKIERISRRGTLKGKEPNPNRKTMADFSGDNLCSKLGCGIVFPPHKSFRPHGGQGVSFKTDCRCGSTTYKRASDLKMDVL